MTKNFSFPRNLLRPVAEFLNAKLALLKKNKKKILTEDPFKDPNRILNNAATDTEAEEQYGHARIVAIKDELNKKAEQIKKALARIKDGRYGICDDCGKMIDTDRLSVFPEATLCVNCEKRREK